MGKWSLIHQLSDCGFPGTPWGPKLAPPLFSPPLSSAVSRLSVGERAPHILIEKGGYLTPHLGSRDHWAPFQRFSRHPPITILLFPSSSHRERAGFSLASLGHFLFTWGYGRCPQTGLCPPLHVAHGWKVVWLLAAGDKLSGMLSSPQSDTVSFVLPCLQSPWGHQIHCETLPPACTLVNP